MFLKLLDPRTLHQRAKESKTVQKKPESKPSPLWNTVVGFINNSTGNSRAPAPICGIMTTEYVVVPVSSEMLDEDAVKVRVKLEDAGFYCEFIADALQRFNEESLVVISWDPSVIEAAKRGASGTKVKRGLCILPGREGRACDGCYDCHSFYQKYMKSKVSQ